MPEVAAEAALRLLSLGGAPWMARQWLQPLWEPALACLRQGDVSLRLVQAFEASWVDFQADDARVWLSQVEGAQQAQPRDPHLQYLAGMLCLRHRLWGKAQGLLGQSVKGLNAPVLQRKAWVALAEMAEQRQEPLEASAAWKQAALISLS
jgi:HemY protein